MTSKDRFLMALRHEEADRIPITDTPWETTIAHWHDEGLAEGQSPAALFGYERVAQGADLTFQFPAEVLEETDGYIVERDTSGVVSRTLKGREATPERRAFTITDRRAWEEHRPRLVWNESRVDWEYGLAANRAFRSKGLFVTYQAGAFGYDLIQRFAGAPQILMAMHDDRAWVKDMIDTVAELIIHAVEEMLYRGFCFDGAFIADDLGFRNGLFFSPALYRELEFPSQKRLCDFFHSRGMPVILHTDGDVRQLVPTFIEAGFDCLQPLEVKAGMDLIELKKQYGDRLAFMGGIDVRAMADPDPGRIEHEIRSKIPIARKQGGYIYHSDHSVPDNVSFAQYCRTMELVHRYGTF